MVSGPPQTQPGLWIQSYCALGDHPKIHKLARLLDISRVTAVGHMQFLWWWAMSYAPDGSLERFDCLDIAIAARWEEDEKQFVDALVAVGFIDELGIHDWPDYGGKLLEERRKNAEKMASWRKRKQHETDTKDDGDGNVTVTLPSRDLLREEKNREEKNREEKLTSFATANAAKAKRATPLPDDFVVTDEMTNWAFAEQFTYQEIEQQTALFRDHFKANGKPMKDWPATWRNWLRRSRTYAHAPKTTNGFGPKGPDAEWFAKQARDLERQGL